MVIFFYDTEVRTLFNDCNGFIIIPNCSRMFFPFKLLIKLYFNEYGCYVVISQEKKCFKIPQNSLSLLSERLIKTL